MVQLKTKVKVLERKEEWFESGVGVGG